MVGMSAENCINCICGFHLYGMGWGRDPVVCAKCGRAYTYESGDLEIVELPNSPTYIVGIDPSLSSTGVCVYCPETCQTHVAQIDGHCGRHPGDRCEFIAGKVLNAISSSGIVDACDSIDVFIECPAGLLQGPAQDLRTLYWAIIRHLEDEEFLYTTIYPVPPTTLKKWLTNRGNCKPEDKVFAVASKLKHMIPPEFVVSDETKGGIARWKDAYDGIGLAALGHCYLGGSGFTKAQQESLKKIEDL